MSTYKEETAALLIFVVLACIAMLFVLRSGWLVTLLTKCKFTWCVAASASLGAVFGQHDWLVSAMSWAMLAAGAWLALLLCLVVCRAAAWVVLWPAIWLARQIDFGRAPARGGSYASPSTRRYTAPAPRHYSAPAGYSGAGYAAAGAAAGYAAGGQAWDMLDPMNAANPLSPPPPMHETLSPFPTDNTNGLPMISGTMVDTTGHAYGDPAPIFEPAPVIYDYAPACDYSNNNFGGSCGGGFDF